MECATNDTAAFSELYRVGNLAVDRAAGEQAGQDVAWGAQGAPVDVAATYTGYPVSPQKGRVSK